MRSSYWASRFFSFSTWSRVELEQWPCAHYQEPERLEFVVLQSTVHAQTVGRGAQTQTRTQKKSTDALSIFRAVHEGWAPQMCFLSSVDGDVFHSFLWGEDAVFLIRVQFKKNKKKLGRHILYCTVLYNLRHKISTKSKWRWVFPSFQMRTN